MVKKTTLEELADMLSHVVDHMATKQDVAEIRDEVSQIRGEVLEIRHEVSEVRSVMVTKTEHEAFRQETFDHMARNSSELATINRRLDNLEEQVGGLKGFAREIDDVRARVKDIEKQLGINKKIAA